MRTLCGLSNISFGLPQRANINGVFLAMALSCGLDGAILDVNSAKVRTPPKRFWERTNTVSTISTPCGISERRRKRGKARFLSLPTLRGDKGEGPGRMRWKRTAEKTGRFPSCHRETMEKIADSRRHAYRRCGRFQSLLCRQCLMAGNLYTAVR